RPTKAGPRGPAASQGDVPAERSVHLDRAPGEKVHAVAHRSSGGMAQGFFRPAGDAEPASPEPGTWEWLRAQNRDTFRNETGSSLSLEAAVVPATRCWPGLLYAPQRWGYHWRRRPLGTRDGVLPYRVFIAYLSALGAVLALD